MAETIIYRVKHIQHHYNRRCVRDSIIWHNRLMSEYAKCNNFSHIIGDNVWIILI